MAFFLFVSWREKILFFCPSIKLCSSANKQKFMTWERLNLYHVPPPKGTYTPTYIHTHILSFLPGLFLQMKTSVVVIYLMIHKMLKFAKSSCHRQSGLANSLAGGFFFSKVWPQVYAVGSFFSWWHCTLENTDLWNMARRKMFRMNYKIRICF